MANDAQTVDYRALLEQERDSLAAQLSELGFSGTEHHGLAYDSNFADTSQVTAERGEAAALATELRSALGDVERALEKLDKGTYGVCERCGKAIAPARLEAKPGVQTCIECASVRR